MRTIILIGLSTYSLLAASPMQEYMATLETEAKAENPAFSAFDAKRGEALFTSSHIGKKGVAIACTSCHTNNLKNAGKNSFTAKAIEPLAPSANPQRLTSPKEVTKWLKRNFSDVYNREGTAQEKGDVLTYIMAQ